MSTRRPSGDGKRSAEATAAESTARRQRRIQAEQDQRDRAGKAKKSDDKKQPVQAGTRRQPEKLPAQHIAKPGHESEFALAPRFLAPDYRGSGKLEGFAAIVTGADSGIGRAVAVLFAREGELGLVTGLGDVLGGELLRLAARAGLHRLLPVVALLRLACPIALILLGLDAALATRRRFRRRRPGRRFTVAARATRAHRGAAEQGVKGAGGEFMAVTVDEFARSGKACARAPATARSRCSTVDPGGIGSRLAASSQWAR